MDIRYYRCNLTKGQHLALYILCAAAMMGVLFLFYHSFVVALPGGLLLGFLPEKMLADRSISRRKNALRLQFKDFLESMSVAVRAGNTELNAIRSALQDLRLSYNENTDIVREVAYIVDAHEKRGLALSELFMDLGMRSDIEDIRSFAEIFQATSGKSDRFRDIVQETQDIISQKIEIPIHSSQADMRHAGLDYGIQLIDRGMSVYLAQFLKNDSTLVRHPCLGHVCSSKSLVIFE